MFKNSEKLLWKGVVLKKNNPYEKPTDCNVWDLSGSWYEQTISRRWGRRQGGEIPRYWIILRNYYNNFRGNKVLWLYLKNRSCLNTEFWNVYVILWSLSFTLKNFLVGEQVTKKMHKIRLAGWWMHKVHYAACRWSGVPKARSKAETLHQICFSFVPKAWLSCMKSRDCQMQKS